MVLFSFASTHMAISNDTNDYLELAYRAIIHSRSSESDSRERVRSPFSRMKWMSFEMRRLVNCFSDQLMADHMKS